MVSTAPTCGLSKRGRLLATVDPKTGKRIQVVDAETGEMTNAIDDKLLADMKALALCKETDTLHFVKSSDVRLRCAVPIYYDNRFVRRFREVMRTKQFEGYTSATLGDLLSREIISIRAGHGSPSHDERIGDVPYIKVSDLRAGLVNINPTNRVPKSVACAYWKGSSSGLRPFDLLCPERTSKNIGDFCVLMPGQEQVVLTKEIIVLRPGLKANFDAFYLLWAMTLKIVREQWRRVIFMQTNREDVGQRYHEIEIPVPGSKVEADKVSETFRNYFTSIIQARRELSDYLHKSRAHHFFVSGAQELDDEVATSPEIEPGAAGAENTGG
jgi:type I restriction enzyme M protein